MIKVEYNDKDDCWWVKTIFSYANKTTVTYFNETALIHNTGGPATISSTGEEWYCNGINLTNEFLSFSTDTTVENWNIFIFEKKLKGEL